MTSLDLISISLPTTHRRGRSRWTTCTRRGRGAPWDWITRAREKRSQIMRMVSNVRGREAWDFGEKIFASLFWNDTRFHDTGVSLSLFFLSWLVSGRTQRGQAARREYSNVAA